MANQYRNFKLAIYCPAGTFEGLSLEQRERDLAFFQRHLRVSKVYLESHRGGVSVGAGELRQLKEWFEARGIETAGGITAILPSTYRPGFARLLGVVCYTDEASRQRIKAEVEVAASVFDEIILDDFFFTNCACEDCIRRRGDRSWADFRLELMAEVSRELFVGPARAVNPRVKMVIKYPNWIESFARTGYNTADQPAIFDGVYTGTETRDPTITQQNLPRYASYSLLRWLEAVKPGNNGGGWFDAHDCSSIDNYLEQAYLTVLGKAREVTLYNYRLHRDSVYVPPLGFQLEKLDALAGHLGHPIGAIAYQPHRAAGEDHLADTLGMLGVPILPAPRFPESAGSTPLFLTEGATRDAEVLARLEAFLLAGGRAVITSGFVQQLQGKGIEKLTSLRPTGRSLPVQRYAMDTVICTFDEFIQSTDAAVYPVLDHATNGTWQGIVGFHGETNFPILSWDYYGKGQLFTLVVPHDPADLAKLPDQVVTKLRSVFSSGMPAQLEGPPEVGFFLYDSDVLVIESFAKTPAKWRIRVSSDIQLLCLDDPEDPPVLMEQSGQECVYGIKLLPTTFRAFRMVREQSRSG